MYLNILDEKRKSFLPVLKRFKDRFYLAGGTGLALQLGHRDSIDFDFFTNQDFNQENLLREIKEAFSGHPISVIQLGNKTLNILIDDEVKASFFCIKEKLIKPVIDNEYLAIASVDDIACMKIVALLRAEFKDYVDLYYIFKQLPLKEVIDSCKIKYDNFEEMPYLKALVSFDDINMTHILFEHDKKIDIKTIKKDFQKRVNEYLNNINK